jgi:ABC-2 type transport system ATP-binding protein
VEPTVRVENLQKTFKVPVREGGLGASVRSLVRREFREVRAVDGVDFSLAPGEVVGFLGPNGAGKTTTLKMLTGLLHPDGGDARVLGYQPWHREKALLRRIALVMGQRNNLAWDLPAVDSFQLNQAIYQITTPDFTRRKQQFLEVLDVAELATKPVRNLSLGERMKMEIVAALLHGPEVLFLDEPTIGLDVSMQRRLRGFIAQYNRETGATVLLTSHYMADVVALAQRVIVIHHGKILYDGALSGLSDRFARYKTIEVVASDLGDDLGQWGELMDRSEGRATLRVPREQIAAATAALLTEFSVTDLTVEDPPIEEVIELVFAQPDEVPG